MGVNLYEADDEAGSVEWKSGKERWIVTGTHIENERKKKKVKVILLCQFLFVLCEAEISGG